MCAWRHTPNTKSGCATCWSWRSILQALAPLPLDRQAVDRGARLIDDELQRLRGRLDRQPEPASAWERLTWWFPRFMPVRMAGLAAAFAIAANGLRRCDPGCREQWAR